MAKVVAGMTVSLDGFVNDRGGSVAALYPDFATFVQADPLQETIQNTGAVVMGRKAYAMAEDPDWYVGNYEFQVPIFVLTHEVPKKMPKQSEQLTFTFVTDGIESAIRQAKAVVGGNIVTVIGGASTVRQALSAGLVDELHLDLMPVLLGGGIRLFESTDSEPIHLERIKVMESPGGRTHLVFRVRPLESRGD